MRTTREVLWLVWLAGIVEVGILAGPWWALVWWIAYPLVVLAAAVGIVALKDWIELGDGAEW